MPAVVIAVVQSIASLFRSRTALQLEILALRHQLIGSIRRECLANVVVLHRRQLHRILTAYFAHYHRWRCHQALDMDCPEPRPIQSRDQGPVVEVTEGGGLYRHYERLAA